MDPLRFIDNQLNLLLLKFLKGETYFVLTLLLLFVVVVFSLKKKRSRNVMMQPVTLQVSEAVCWWQLVTVYTEIMCSLNMLLF